MRLALPSLRSLFYTTLSLSIHVIFGRARVSAIVKSFLATEQSFIDCSLSHGLRTQSEWSRMFPHTH